MKYVKKYPSVTYSLDAALEAENAAAKLEQSLKALRVSELSVSEYGERYFRYDMSKITFILQGYVFIILSVAEKLGSNYKEITIIDQGGGVGLFSFFCKMLGIRTVIYNDSNPVVREDARKFARALNLEIDHYCVGDTPEMMKCIQEKGLQPRVLASRNVLEHIYDIDLFFKTMSGVSGDISLFMSTSANMKNPLVNIYTRRIQKKFERVGRKDVEGKLIPGSAYVDIRKKFIREKYPGLKAEEYDRLAISTRGLNLADISRKVEHYLSTGNYPVLISDATNTCDPYTGNWMEHLVPVGEYGRLGQKNGFSFDYHSGFYNTHYSRKLFNVITPVLNFFIYAFGKRGLFLAPFMMIIAESGQKGRRIFTETEYVGSRIFR